MWHGKTGRLAEGLYWQTLFGFGTLSMGHLLTFDVMCIVVCGIQGQKSGVPTYSDSIFMGRVAHETCTLSPNF